MSIRPKLNKKIIIALLIITLAAGAAIFLTKKDSLFQSDNNDRTANEDTNAPKATDAPKPDNLQDPQEGPSLDAELPEGTLSPHAVASDPGKYLGKEVVVRGLLVKSGEDTYSIVSQKPEEELGLRLDLSKSGLNIEEYSSPATVTGKLKVPDGKNPLTLQVLSIQK